MYVSSFRDLQKIYEDYRGMSFNPSPNKSYTAEPSNYSYRGTLPFNAGGADNQYAAGAVQPHGPTPISCDEEGRDDGEIKKRDVIEHIKSLQKQAIADEMQYAAHMLGLVKEFIRTTT